MRIHVLLVLAVMAGSATAEPWSYSEGFETPNIRKTGVDYREAEVFYHTFFAGQNIGAWKVSDGTVDIVRHKRRTASEGHQSLDLNGISAGTIGRTFRTKPGATYRLTFDLSGNPIGGFLSLMEVRWNGKLMGTFRYDTAPQTNSYAADMRWKRETLVLAADSTQGTLEFRSLTQGMSGPALDGIRLEKVRK